MTPLAPLKRLNRMATTTTTFNIPMLKRLNKTNVFDSEVKLIKVYLVPTGVAKARNRLQKKMAADSPVEALEPDEYLCESDSDDDAMQRHSTVPDDARAALEWAASLEGQQWIERVKEAGRAQREREARALAAAERERQVAAERLRTKKVERTLEDWAILLLALRQIWFSAGLGCNTPSTTMALFAAYA